MKLNSNLFDAARIAASAVISRTNSLTIFANNSANTNTVGFKPTRVIFNEFIIKKDNNNLAFVNDVVTYKDPKPGGLVQTKNNLDIAIQGTSKYGAYLGINGPGGKKLYTKAGSMTKDSAGVLVTPLGYEITSQAGGPIVIPTDASRINITEDGSIYADENLIAKLNITSFEDEKLMTNVGDNLLDIGGANIIEGADYKVLQGMLEESAENPAQTMINLMEGNRRVEMSSNFIHNIYKLVGEAQDIYKN